MVIRAKTNDLRQTRPITLERAENTKLNVIEMEDKKLVLQSKPQRLVFELTNTCNLNCVMCGRNAATFKPMFFNIEWFKRFEGIFNSIEEITLMGWGEPTVHPDFVDMLKIMDKSGLRKYFCTNGMKLKELEREIFDCGVDIIGISLDGADKQTTERIRRGVDFDKVIHSIQSITNRKSKESLQWPYMNFVFTAMNSNIEQLPKIVDLASDIGIDEVKVVFLTVFEESLLDESLYERKDMVRDYFEESQKRAEKHNVTLKLPHLTGNDPAGKKYHKDCFTAYRDFFLGSDGYVRACMSTPRKLFHIDKYDNFDSMWNSGEYLNWRNIVNEPKKMDDGCKQCYQSSFANWNKKHSFIQIGNQFSPQWGEDTSNIHEFKITPYNQNTENFLDEIKNILQIAEGLNIDKLLSINPRDGDIPLALKEENHNMIIDSFVSDKEWIESAEKFSNKVVTGNSHMPLKSLQANTYDVVLVCEDIAQVDDPDAMIVNYYKLLKPGGVLLSPVWNMRYHVWLKKMLIGESLPVEWSQDLSHGCGSVPIDGLTARLSDIGFSPIELYNSYGERADVSLFIEISVINDEPAEESYFLTKTYFVKAVKK